jgi:serine/threonine protein phosphatase PrpC
VDIEKVSWGVAGRRLTAAAGSVTGTRYDRNYDVYRIDPATPFAVVADGMGAGEGSATAGRVAVETLARELRPGERQADGPGARTGADPAALRAAVALVQREVRAAGRPLDELTGCTLTAFVAGPGASAAIVQLGDSRAYRLRNGLLELLTVDHTVAWLGLLHGWFAHDSREARAARYRLTRYAGHPDEPEPDVLDVSLRAGDVFLLCTDGIADQVSYERITQLLGTTPDPAAAVQSLLEDSLAAGGTDNATAVVVRAEPTVTDH